MSNTKDIINNYLEKYFKKVKDVIDFNVKEFKKHKLQIAKINYQRIKEFIDRAINYLSNIDESIITPLLQKIYEDVNNLITFKKSFIKETQNINNIYILFLNQYEPYQKLQKQIDDIEKKKNLHYKTMTEAENELKFTKPEDDITHYKNLKKKYVDSLYFFSEAKEKLENLTSQLKQIKEELHQEFIRTFENFKEEYLTKLNIIINTKIYYLNALLWYEVNKSITIKHHFVHELNIKQPINLQLFIKTYLEHINIPKSKRANIYREIEDILKVLDKED